MPYNYEQGRYVHQFDDWGGIPEIERNLITFATTRSGKGATQIMPALKDWDGANVLVVDPKGEAAEITAIERAKKFGQASRILDPFKTAKFTKKQRARYNPLDEIDPAKPSAFRQINAIADGLVMRHDPKGEHWEGGGVEVIAGFIAHVLTAPDFEGRRNLVTVRQLLKATGSTFDDIVQDLAENFACGGLAQTAANKLLNTGTESGHFLSSATSNTKWLDDPDIAECLSDSTFSMSDLKRKKTDVFLILPMDALNDYGRFLRLFVRLAIWHMQQKMPNGDLKGKSTFFILDEFYSLGYIEEIAKTVGGMPGFALHLWPFLQDLNQLHKLYGREGAGTFLANCDCAFFYGVNDPDTARYVSDAAGLIQEHELKVKPPRKPQFDIPNPASGWDRFLGRETLQQRRYRIATEPPAKSDGFGPWTFDDRMQEHHRERAAMEQERANQEAAYQDKMNAYGHARSCVGHARVPPEQVMQITKRNPKRKISDHALVLQDGSCWLYPLTAYFED